MNMKSITSSNLILLVSIFLILSGNYTFFIGVLGVYPMNGKYSLFLVSLAILFASVNVFTLSLVCYKYTMKPILITVLLSSSAAAYFMDTYHVIINDEMVTNIISTDIAEAFDLITVKLFIYLVFLGILPSILVYKAHIVHRTLKYSLTSRIILSAVSIVIAFSMIVIFGDFYASFFREHKPLRFYANPSFYVYSVGKYINKFVENKSIQYKLIGLDATIPVSDKHRDLVIFVVGETARADHFSLNGYSNNTNPYLEKENVISFNNFWSCGTTTATSVPCMFSIYKRGNFTKNKAKAIDNVLDILQRAGVNVLWLDNNSGSKGVADRVPYENYKTPDKNPICDRECRDEGMLENLQRFIDKHSQGDIFIVLHQMGNHGPAYYKRYPPEFEKFTPTCQTSQLELCSVDAINNTYDNAILYTDYFLAKAITLLKQNSDHFESALFYVSDHGESLGENNVYLHGLPYIIAPDAQTNVPMIIWLGDSFESEEHYFDKLQNNKNNKYSHDNIFHTILGLLEVETNVYDQTMDILKYRTHD